MRQSYPPARNSRASRWSKVARPPRSGEAGPIMTTEPFISILFESQFLFDEIGIAARGIPGDEFGDKAGEKKLGPQHHAGERDVERGLVRQRERGHIVQLLDQQRDRLTKTDQPADDPPGAKEVHRPFAILADKGDRRQIEQALQPPAQAAKLGVAIFSWPVLD